MRLNGHTALISGRSSGIGRGVALGLAREGAAAIVINYPDEAQREVQRCTRPVSLYGGKAGVIAFSRSLALEIGARDVRINCVAPGATQTPILDSVAPDVLSAIRAAIPIGRLAEVDDIVPTYVMLASADGRHYQGQCLSPNGGDHFL